MLRCFLTGGFQSKEEPARRRPVERAWRGVEEAMAIEEGLPDEYERVPA